eukprot:CAMPEP_0202916346 /NCGR_PEP_ID=MMETSP1392-20130828/68354_1 /ASSEMBLY_ACC=CAM_ASM_000868 /TAXON_ID=225041 /ORGANISM="Chlamydomonas chlamydogama, Strain SAG 11-48b" /LENGTH=332 /DNA_ID=CAMNT_0049608747 /DNA_START=130 /DNA_END=1125 /DNA_ORIENTATION=-
MSRMFSRASKPGAQFDDIVRGGPAFDAVWACKILESRDIVALRRTSKASYQSVNTKVESITLDASDMPRLLRSNTFQSTLTSNLLQLTQLSTINIGGLSNQACQQFIHAVDAARIQVPPQSMDRIKHLSLGAVGAADVAGYAVLDSLASSAMQHLRSLGLARFDLTSCGPLLARLTSLAEVRLDGNKIDNGILQGLVQLPILHSLSLDFYTIKAHNLYTGERAELTAALQQLTGLSNLKLLPRAGMLHMSDLTCITANTGLTSLTFTDGRPVSNSSLGALVPLAALKHVTLQELELTNEGVAHLRRLPQLESLTVASLELTDACPPGGLPTL